MRKLEGKLYEAVRYATEHFAPVRAVYERAGIQLDHIRDFTELPFISKKDLNRYPFQEMVATPMSEIVRVFTSTGTTSKPGFVGFTRNDWQRQIRMLTESLKRIGISKDDVYYDIIPRTTLFASYICLAVMEEIGATVIPAGQLPLERHMELMAEFRPTFMLGISHFVIKLGEELPDEVKQSIKRISLVGEVLHESTRKKIEKLYPEAIVYSGFGMSEVLTSSECEQKNGFHVDPDEVYIEVIDADEDGVGELVYTSLNSEAMPLTRYRSGDLGRLDTEPCPCGCTYPRFSVFGRRDHMANIKGKLVDLNRLKQVVLDVEGIEFARAVYVPGERARLEIHYTGEIDEQALRESVKLHTDITPIPIRQTGGSVSQWKEKFFSIDEGNL